MGRFQINKKFWPMKAHFFLWNAGTAPVVPFMSVYARQLGFSSSIVGIIYTVLPICGMIAKPLFGGISDRFRCRRAIFLAFQLATAVAFLGINYVPEVEVQQRMQFACDNGEAALDTCHMNVVGDAVNGSGMKDGDGAPECNGEKTWSGDTRVIECKLNCPLSDEEFETVGNFWKADQYLKSHPKNLEFTAHVPLDHTWQTGPNCYFFKVANVTLSDGILRYPICPTPASKIVAMCDINCQSERMNSIVRQSNIPDDEVTGLYQFWLFLGLMIFGWVCQAIVVSVGDAICFEMLEDRPDKYGRQRSFGALGWGVFSIIAGFLVDSYSKDDAKKDYTLTFYLAVVVLVLDFLTSFKIQHTQKNLSASILRDVSQLLVDVRILVFICWCIFVGICTGLIWNFLFWLLEDLAKAYSCEAIAWVKTLQGIVMAVQCLGGELPLFFLSGRILKRIGHVHAMSLILVVIGIRYILYSVITNPWWILPVELTNGLTFGLFYSAMASYASIVARPGTETTVQGLVGAVFEGVGVSMGSFIGGSLYDSYGGPLTFRIFGIAALIACLVHVAVQWLLHRSSKDKMGQYSTPEDALNMFDEDQELSFVAS